jgi:antirestriction protein ArdC
VLKNDKRAVFTAAAKAQAAADFLMPEAAAIVAGIERSQ